jgi:taurine dioxygenase
MFAVILPTDGAEIPGLTISISRPTAPADLKQAIEGKRQRHDASRNSAGVLRPTVKLPATPEEVRVRFIRSCACTR